MTSKTVKNVREPLKKPRPLKSVSVDQTKEGKPRSDVLSELEDIVVRVGNYDFDETDISSLCSLLKKNGEDLDSTNKEAVDRMYSTLRNVCRDDRLDPLSRLKLLEIIELRAMHWGCNENIINYYNSKFTYLEGAGERLNLSGSISPNSPLSIQNQNFSNSPSVALAPGELLRSSGKFNKPTKIAGKNYFKDEIVIRNCDSGKVMGIRGRRVHMIEELSDTVISFQRVNAGAKDRLVQITGPHEDAISHAKYLVEDTIKRNVSPVRENLNLPDIGVDNKDVVDYGSSSRRSLVHSYSTNDATSRDVSVPVYIGNEVIMLSGTKPDLLKTAKTVLEDYFDSHSQSQDKVFPLSKSASLNNNQRFVLKKQASIKEKLPTTLDPSFSRRSSSMSSSSDELLPDEETRNLEAISPPVPVPIPPPNYPTHPLYSREFLLECSRLPLSQVKPPSYDHITASFPEIIPQIFVMFDPTHSLQNKPKVL